jgi:hypothetical protein
VAARSFPDMGVEVGLLALALVMYPMAMALMFRWEREAKDVAERVSPSFTGTGDLDKVTITLTGARSQRPSNEFID